MKTEETSITVTDQDFGFEEEELIFRYTEKNGGDRRVERYQVLDVFGVVYSGEKIWRTEESGGLFGYLTEKQEVNEENVQKRVAYDSTEHSVITEEASWSEFRDFLSVTEAEEYIC